MTVLGIDVGGSTTKIVGMEDGRLCSMQCISADDPVTGPVTVAGGEEQTVHLILDGAPSESLEEQTVIGNVSVTLGGS